MKQTLIHLPPSVVGCCRDQQTTINCAHGACTQTLAVVTVVISMGCFGFFFSSRFLKTLGRSQHEGRWEWSLRGLLYVPTLQNVSTCWAGAQNGEGFTCAAGRMSSQQSLTSAVLCRIPTVGMWGTVGTIGLVWATDWRLILDWVPYINGKFKDN